MSLLLSLDESDLLVGDCCVPVLTRSDADGKNHIVLPSETLAE